MLKAEHVFSRAVRIIAPKGKDGEPLRPQDLAIRTSASDVTDIAAEYKRLKATRYDPFVHPEAA